jgi:hypothetical protein
MQHDSPEQTLPSLPNEPPAEQASEPMSPAAPETRPQVRQLALQCAALIVVLSLAWPYFGLRDQALPWPETALAIGAVALLIASLTRQPWWWRVIHALFAPLAWAVSAFGIAPGWFLLAFILLWVVYRGALGGQVPLYLSNRETANALAELTADLAGMRFADLGAGLGSVVCPLARARPDAQFCGVENAPASWLIGYLRTLPQRNCQWHWGDLWRENLAQYDVVYAFLSPAAMPGLWAKVEGEMRAGSLFISNSFAVPGVAASAVVEVGDARRTQLYCYRRAAAAAPLTA